MLLEMTEERAAALAKTQTDEQIGAIGVRGVYSAFAAGRDSVTVPNQSLQSLFFLAGSEALSSSITSRTDDGVTLNLQTLVQRGSLLHQAAVTYQEEQSGVQPARQPRSM